MICIVSTFEFVRDPSDRPISETFLRAAAPLNLGPERQERDVLRPLDGHRKPALVPRASAGHAPWQDLAAFLDELPEDVCLFVVDQIHLVDAKAANLLPANVAALAPLPAGAASASGSPSRTRPAATGS
jgi:hypothetical protein